MALIATPGRVAQGEASKLENRRGEEKKKIHGAERKRKMDRDTAKLQ